ncbi:MAG TPA: LEA type 2 family protein [Polyangiaceae bacterium]|nr:LEA type 2 family protein [Polyangiaceae bacterium]
MFGDSGFRRPARGLRNSWLALFGAVAAFGSACAKPQPPSVVPHVVKMSGVSAGGLDFDVELQVHNPNSFPLAAEAVSGTLYGARDQKLGQGTSHPREAIPADSTRLVSSQVHIGWENVTALAPLLAAESIPYEFRGDVTLGGDSLNVTLPFSLSGELTRTQLLEAGWRGL